MASVMGLLEEREAVARVRVEELQAEADRILAELAAAEAVLERRAIARAELAEALAAPGDAADAAVQEAPDPVPEARAVKVPVAGSIVPHFGEGMTVQALAPDYRRIVELNSTGSEPYSNDTRASRQCSVRFASPSYREALTSCAHRGESTPAGNLFDLHVP
ncbi:hypothetical protein ACWGI9_44380 [Streptomyces sp. NPDC054833]